MILSLVKSTMRQHCHLPKTIETIDRTPDFSYALQRARKRPSLPPNSPVLWRDLAPTPPLGPTRVFIPPNGTSIGLARRYCGIHDCDNRQTHRPRYVCNNRPHLCAETHRSTLSLPDMELGHLVTGSMGHLGHLSRPGYRVTGSSF